MAKKALIFIEIIQIAFYYIRFAPINISVPFFCTKKKKNEYTLTNGGFALIQIEFIQILFKNVSSYFVWKKWKNEKNRS